MINPSHIFLLLCILVLTSCQLDKYDAVTKVKTYYYSNGKVEKMGKEEDYKAEGLWKFYYETGELRSETYFLNDIRHGKNVHYWPNGKKNIEGVYNHGEMDSLWLTWNEDGTPHKWALYDKGKLLDHRETTTFDSLPN